MRGRPLRVGLRCDAALCTNGPVRYPVRSRAARRRQVSAGWLAGSTIMTFQSGFPAPVTLDVDTTGTGIASRPDQIAGQNGDLPGDKRTWKHWFNTARSCRRRLAASAPRRAPTPFRLPGITNSTSPRTRRSASRKRARSNSGRRFSTCSTTSIRIRARWIGTFEFGDVRIGGRRRAGRHDARDSVRSQALLLSPAPLKLQQRKPTG